MEKTRNRQKDDIWLEEGVRRLDSQIRPHISTLRLSGIEKG